jgi:hypothetical protein
VATAARAAAKVNKEAKALANRIKGTSEGAADARSAHAARVLNVATGWNRLERVYVNNTFAQATPVFQIGPAHKADLHADQRFGRLANRQPDHARVF